MSPKKPVYFLNYLCQKVLIDYLIESVSPEEFNQYEELSVYFENVPIDIIEELLTLIMTYEDVRSAIKFKCFKVLFKDGVKHLDCSVISQRFHQDIAEAIKKNGGKLKHLDLRRFDHNNLEEVLQDLSKLTVLLVPHIADNNVLRLLNNMKNLTTLNISDVHPSILHGEILRNFKSDSLTFLDIGTKGKPEICFDMGSFEVLADMLINLTNLKHIKTYSFTGHAILSLHQRFPDQKTKLLSLKSTGTNHDILQAIASACPHLENIELTKPLIKDLNSLKKLKNAKISCPNDSLSSYLTTSKLNGLNLTCCSNFRPSSINLTSLKCREVKLTLPKPTTMFKSLQIVELFSCGSSKNCVKSILINSPNLKRFVLTDEVYFKDNDIEEICEKCELKELEEFWLSKAECLTIKSARLLVKHCKSLKVLGQLGRWDVEMQEVNFIRWEAHMKNVMVNIFNYSFFKF